MIEIADSVVDNRDRHQGQTRSQSTSHQSRNRFSHPTMSNRSVSYAPGNSRNLNNFIGHQAPTQQQDNSRNYYQQ